MKPNIFVIVIIIIFVSLAITANVLPGSAGTAYPEINHSTSVWAMFGKNQVSKPDRDQPVFYQRRFRQSNK